MPLPSPWPRWHFSRAYDALIDVLRDDPLLKRTVNTWRTWDGEPDDAAVPEPKQMPWIRLTPTLSPIELATEGDYQVPFAVQIEMACNTTDARHMLDFWGAIVEALVGEKPFRGKTVRGFLGDEGNVITYNIVKTGGAPVLNPGAFMSSTAVVSLLLYIPA